MAVILVTDGDQRSALATVRSLGRAGHEVHVTRSTGRTDLAGASRYAVGAHDVAPSADRPAFARSLAAVALELDARVVLPVTDASVQAVLEHEELFQGRVLPLPDLAAFLQVVNKEATLALAEELEMKVPFQMEVLEPGVLPDTSPSFPVAVKPARSVPSGPSGPPDMRSSSFKVAYARDREELEEILSGAPEESFPLLVQQRIEGPGTGLFFLRWDDQILARFAHRRIREKPPSGGVSVLREGVAFDRDLGVRSEALLRRLGWRGVAMVEFKVDAASGEAYLMEVNGRLWGSLQLAIDSGVDFPRLLVDAALGSPTAMAEDYRVGRKLRWFWGDTDHLGLCLLRSREVLDLTESAPSRPMVILGWLAAFGPGIRSEVWRWRDLGPFIAETRARFRNFWTR